MTITNPSIRYADASQSQQNPPSKQNNNNPHGCRAEVLSPDNNNSINYNGMQQRQKQARDVERGFCANNEKILPSSSSLTTEQDQQQQDEGEEKKTPPPPEALFGGRGGGRRGPGPARPDPGQDGGDPLPKDDDIDDDPKAAALFSPTANPNLCRDPNHPIPVCHKLVQSFFGDLDNVPYELPRCYPC